MKNNLGNGSHNNLDYFFQIFSSPNLSQNGNKNYIFLIFLENTRDGYGK